MRRAWEPTAAVSAAVAIALILEVTTLAAAGYISSYPGDHRLIKVDTKFEFLESSDGRDNYRVTVSTAQNHNILGRLFDPSHAYSFWHYCCYHCHRDEYKEAPVPSLTVVRVL